MIPELISLKNILVKDDLSDIESIFNKYGVVIIELNSISKQDKIAAIDKTTFYSNLNSFLKDEHQVIEPSLSEKLNPKSFKNRKAPDNMAGFIHQYNTPIHQQLHNNDKLVESFIKLNPLYSTKKYAPNRIRISSKTYYKDTSLHIEGDNIFNINGENISLNTEELASIVGLSGKRRFVFWDMYNANLKPLYDYCKKKNNKNFVKIDPLWMNENYPNRRKVIEIDCNEHPMLIIWSESVPHEIASMPSFSAYISPIESYNNTLSSKVTSFQALEYINLTEHESNLIGLCYNMPGLRWPSGKKAYSFCHIQSYFHWKSKLKDYFIENDKIRIKLPKHGTINHKSEEYISELNKRKINLNSIVFSNEMPLFVVDILMMTDKELKLYGFILT